MSSLSKRNKAIAVFIFILITTTTVWAVAYSRLYLTIDNARVSADLITIRSESDGRIVMADAALRSERVPKGQQIIALDAREIRLQLQVSDAEIAQIEAEKQLNQQRYEVAIANNKEQATQFIWQQELLNRELALKQESTRLQMEKTDNIQNLATTAAVSRQDKLTAQSALQQALLDIDIHQARIAEHAVNQALLSNEKRQADLILHEISRLESQKQAAQAQRALLEYQLEKLTSSAPFDGVIDEVFVRHGEYVEEGQRLYMMHDLNSLKVEANILESDLGKVHLGQQVEVQLSYQPGQTISGVITRIASVSNDKLALIPTSQMSSDFVRVKQRFTLDIKLDNTTSAMVAPGMMSTVIIPL
ncbi:multidrug resistance protein A [Pseudoalteromonas rubra]|uniref:Multidrug resistance protein A n=1 Tax=Pseudoalteromonas rubra TaxID=43658 RepID=A0A8T0CD73_9GAMM|nr:HlyD family efflux transporter periplasmic adaptor subunit [Pseudoalteromonas rubra]KAF7788490.1 multidrug resistance protein A [Pseudoalteromonas rubra]